MKEREGGGQRVPDPEGKGRQAALEASGQGADMYREQLEWDVTSSCHPTQDTGEGKEVPAVMALA